MKKTKIIGSAGATGTGTAVGLSGQAAAMGIATTFGTASKGTAIFSLTGVTVDYGLVAELLLQAAETWQWECRIGLHTYRWCSHCHWWH